jgi:hypothetical protein
LPNISASQLARAELERQHEGRGARRRRVRRQNAGGQQQLREPHPVETATNSGCDTR